ncbi:MAG: DUF5663 domain-containing protein [Candidatus Paceibacterota bacterium]
MINLSKEVITEWKLGSLDHDKQVEMVDRIGHILYQAILVRSLDILSEKEQDEFDLLLDEDNTTPQDVLVFLKGKIPTFDSLAKEEKEKVKEVILA